MAGARLVVSESGDILSPKYAPEMTAPAVIGAERPMIWAMPINARPIVPAVVHELPIETATRAQMIRAAEGSDIAFEVDPFRKHCLLEGLDDIGLTLQYVDDIKAYEERRRREAPWLFG